LRTLPRGYGHSCILKADTDSCIQLFGSVNIIRPVTAYGFKGILQRRHVLSNEESTVVPRAKNPHVLVSKFTRMREFVVWSAGGPGSCLSYQKKIPLHIFTSVLTADPGDWEKGGRCYDF